MVERILKFLLNHVADHASGLGAQHIQWISLIRLVGCALKRQQADLRTVAVGDHQPMAGVNQLGQRTRRLLNIGALVHRGHWLAAF